MWLHRIRDMPPSQDELDGKGRAVKPVFYAHHTGEYKRYYPPGHFFSPYHRNPGNAQHIKTFDPSKPRQSVLIDSEEKKVTQEPI